MTNSDLRQLSLGEILDRTFSFYRQHFVLFVGIAVRLVTKDPGFVEMWVVLGQVGNFLATTLVTPILTIATAVFYYDLRVRKEAFDL